MKLQRCFMQSPLQCPQSAFTWSPTFEEMQTRSQWKAQVLSYACVLIKKKVREKDRDFAMRQQIRRFFNGKSDIAIGQWNVGSPRGKWVKRDSANCRVTSAATARCWCCGRVLLSWVSRLFSCTTGDRSRTRCCVNRTACIGRLSVDVRGFFNDRTRRSLGLP
jgi:hypothetical protein